MGDPFQNFFAKLGFIKKHTDSSDEGELLALCGHKEILKNSSSLKLLVRF